MLPFDVKKLNALMEEARLNLFLASSRHNVRYLTGGYYFHFHSRFTRLGRSQYLSFVGLPRDRIQDAFYIGRPDEQGQMEAEGLWIVNRHGAARGTVGAADGAAEAIRKLGLSEGAIGVELSFLPADAYVALQRGLPRASLVDATPLLDELRAVKTPAELAHLRTVYHRTAEAIQAAFASGRAEVTTAAIAARVRQEMERRGLGFLWAFTCAGPGYLRAPSQARWERGRVLHIDAGGEDRDYLADICRMGCLGRPSSLARELHQACLETQAKVRRLIRPGLPCGELLNEGERAIRGYPFAAQGRFVAHGIGMVSHEQPAISPGHPRPLETGMVLSIETEFLHSEVGHVKIEDAVAVTETGGEGLGDLGRDWHVVEPCDLQPERTGAGAASTSRSG
jgi:Xaa-Pro aminopeptidase